MKAIKNSYDDPIMNEEDEATYEFDKEALFNNTQTRCPVVLLIDTSASMGYGKLYNGIVPIDEVNKGINQLFDYIRDDYTCSKRCEICVISFNTNTTLVTDFSPIDTKKPISLKAGGQTNFGPALRLMLDKIDERKKQYDSLGRHCYRPIVIMLTDGGPGDISAFEQMKKEVYEATKQKKLTFNAIKVGTEANLQNHKKHFDMLQGFDVKIPAGSLDVDKFKEFFVWLSRSVEQRSNSKDENDTSFANPSEWWKGTC